MARNLESSAGRGDIFPRIPFDGTWEVVEVANFAVPGKPCEITTRDPRHFDEQYFPVKTHIKLEVSDDGDELHPEWRTMEMTFLPPMPESICRHVESVRLGCGGGLLSVTPITWNTWLQMKPFGPKEVREPFYRKFGVKAGDFRFSIVRQDKAFSWNSVFFQNWGRLVVEVCYSPAGPTVDWKSSSGFEVAGMILKRAA